MTTLDIRGLGHRQQGQQGQSCLFLAIWPPNYGALVGRDRRHGPRRWTWRSTVLPLRRPSTGIPTVGTTRRPSDRPTGATITAHTHRSVCARRSRITET
ncbi:hypothetical protein K466DRAFT_363042 [Polyporus arcularius HHB13444]|uniref:Uncharacterized protein n=1 Tax=Polyporus arcularius HHB13444 TaxID=1314778 RepID=A0A5C3PPF8_9APHY|nr:hypothetical protein K466DRAFT_363042 [Polyporus arcularius HHB13444]